MIIDYHSKLGLNLNELNEQYSSTLTLNEEYSSTLTLNEEYSPTLTQTDDIYFTRKTT